MPVMRAQKALSVAFAIALITPSALQLSLQPLFAAATECADGIDNDLDGRVDYPNDDDCASLIDTLERPTSVDFDVQMSDGNEFAQRGEILEYTLRIENRLSEATIAAVRVSLSNLVYTVDPPAGAEEVDSRTLRWASMPFAANEVKTIIVKARIVEHTPDGSAILSRVTVANVAATDQTMVNAAGLPPATIAVSINDGTETVAPGAEHVYTVRVTNQSPYAAHGINIAASLPIYSQFLSTNEGGFWDGRNVRWNKMTIDAKSSRELNFAVLIDADAQGKVLLAGVAASDKRDSDQTTVTTKAAKATSSASSSSRSATSSPVRVVFRIAADRTETVMGGTADFQMDLRNTSDTDLRDLTVRMTYDSAKVTLEDSIVPERASANWLEWDIASLPAGASWQNTVTLRARAGVVGADAITVDAAIVGAGSTQIVSGSRMAHGAVGTLGALPTTGGGLDALAMIAAAVGCLGLTLVQRRMISQ